MLVLNCFGKLYEATATSAQPLCEIEAKQCLGRNANKTIRVITNKS